MSPRLTRSCGSSPTCCWRCTFESRCPGPGVSSKLWGGVSTRWWAARLLSRGAQCPQATQHAHQCSIVLVVTGWFWRSVLPPKIALILLSRLSASPIAVPIRDELQTPHLLPYRQVDPDTHRRVPSDRAAAGCLSRLPAGAPGPSGPPVLEPPVNTCLVLP